MMTEHTQSRRDQWNAAEGKYVPDIGHAFVQACLAIPRGDTAVCQVFCDLLKACVRGERHPEDPALRKELASGLVDD